ncbi:MAG: hypothetical protein NTV05_17165 [Acidobacteria bacterium]|nr:hypothetical protein [Acidobacteriota bacterium]
MDDFEADYYLALVRVVAKLGDPAAIPSLVGSVDSGMTAIYALVRFEPSQLVPLLVTVAGAGDIGANGPSAGEVTGALRTLALIMGSEQRTRLSTQLDARVRAVAWMRLTGVQTVHAPQGATDADVAGIVMEACGLAAATRDPDLVHRVERLADNRAEVAALGASQERAIDLAQMGCRSAVARIR